jgi:Flp pilus assembly protein CpaB
MKTKLVPLLGIAFVVALIATGIFYGLVVGKLRSASLNSGVPVVVAARALPRGTVIQAEDVRQNPMPEAPKGTFSAPDQAVGLTVLEPISENDPISDAKVATHKSIPSGMRAISIHVTDSSGIVTMLHPGYKVDVQVVTIETGRPALRTILQGIEVLATAAPDANRPVVNLLVTPEQADVLGLADTTAKLRVVLRNPKDNGQPERGTILGDTLIRPVKSGGK